MSDIRNLVNQMVSRYMGNSAQSPLTLPAVEKYSAADSSPYGQCPTCGADGVSRERRLNGNDRCANGHEYPSASAVTKDSYARKHKPATGQLGLFEKPSEKQKPLFSKKVDDEAGRWITMRGARVFISGDDGRVLKGPKRLMGKTKEMIEKESASTGKGEGVEKPPMPKGLAEMGRIKGGRKDNRQKGLFEEINPGFKWDEDEDVKTVGPMADDDGKLSAMESAQNAALAVNGTLEGPEADEDYKTAYLKERERQKQEEKQGGEKWGQKFSPRAISAFNKAKQAGGEEFRSYLSGRSEHAARAEALHTDGHRRLKQSRNLVEIGDDSFSNYLRQENASLDNIPDLPLPEERGRKAAKNSLKVGDLVSVPFLDGSEAIARLESRQGKKQVFKYVTKPTAAEFKDIGDSFRIHADDNFWMFGLVKPNEVGKVLPPVGASKDEWEAFRSGTQKEPDTFGVGSSVKFNDGGGGKIISETATQWKVARNGGSISSKGQPLEVHTFMKESGTQVGSPRRFLVLGEQTETDETEKYSREQLVQTMNTVIDRYIRPEREVVPVDKYAHPLIHAAVGGLGHMAVQSLVKNTTLRRIAHAAVASAMAAWMASANAGQGPSSSPAVNQPAVSAPASPFARQQSGNRSIDAIVNQAFQNHQQAVAEAKAEKGIPADPVQAVPHSVSNTTGARAPGVKPLRGEDEPKSANPSTSPAGKGEGFTDNEHPRHPAGAPESKGGEFAPKGGVEPGSESGSESPRNYPDNLNKPADQQTNYSPPERSIEGLAGDSGNDEPKSLEQKIAEHRMKLASQKSAPEPKASRRDDPDTSWKRAMNFGTERVQASKDAKSQERKAKKQQEQQAKQQEQAVSFDPDQLEREAESSMADADSDASSFDSKPKSEDFKREKDYQRALKAWKREKGASKASITKKIAKSVVPEIATEYELDHSELESAVNDAIAMESEGHKRQEEARKYVTDRGYNAGRINRNEDSGKDHSSTSLDEFASEWAGLYPEIAGSDESQWVDRMWNLAKAGKQDAPSSGDEGFVRKVAERLHGQKMAGGDSSPFPADSDSDSEPDPGPIHGQVGDVDFTPFHRKSLAKELGLLVDKYLREHLVT